MKYLTKIALTLLLIGISSCEKQSIQLQPTASLNVINAVVGGGIVKLNTNVRDSVLINNGKLFAIVPGNAITLKPTNGAVPYYSENKPLTENGGTYSVFLGGLSSSVESFFLKENIPAPYKDSSVGVRIVNLSPNSTPINVTLQSANTTNVFTAVAYKQVTDIKKFPVATVIPTGSLTFQFRSAANPTTVLATYTLPTSANSLYPGISIALQRFKNITIVIRGLQGTSGGATGFGVFPVAVSY